MSESSTFVIIGPTDRNIGLPRSADVVITHQGDGRWVINPARAGLTESLRLMSADHREAVVVSAGLALGAMRMADPQSQHLTELADAAPQDDGGWYRPCAEWEPLAAAVAEWPLACVVGDVADGQLTDTSWAPEAWSCFAARDWDRRPRTQWDRG